MDRQVRRIVLIWVTVCVWTMAIVLASNRLKLAAKSAITITLLCKPTSIKLTIDGEKQEDGNYLETPTKFLLKPGRHKVKIARDGYVAHVITVEGDAGEVFRMDEVVLARNPDVSLVNIDLVDDGSAVHYEVDDGLYRGDTPETGLEVTENDQHTITFFPKWPNRDTRSKCRFNTGDLDAGASYKIHVKIKGTKLKVTGCEPLTAAKRK